MNQLEEKLNFIEKGIVELKLILIQQNIPKTRVSLKGLLKGLKVGDSDIEESKKSLFRTGV